MSGVLDNGASLPRNSRKHRRLDDDPPDGGGTVDPAATVAGGTLDQIIEYESLPTICFHCGKYGHLQDKCPDTQQPSTVEETIVPPVSNQQRAEESSYGPWMVVERRPRKTLNKQVITINDKPGMIFQGSRFNPLRASEENVDAPSEPLAEVPIQQVRSAASIPRAKPRNKGKSTLSFSNPAIHRKPPVVNLADFPVLNRNHSKASSSSRTSLDQLRHTTVVIDENSDPNVGLPTKNSTPPQNSDQQSLMGDPPDIPALSDPPPSHGVTVDTSMQPRAIDESCEALDPAQARFLPAARQVLRDSKPDLVVFVEPRISGRKADSVIALLGFPNSHRVEAIGFSGGIWLAWYDSISVEILVNHFQFIHCRVTVKLTNLSVYV
ncbi:hypothetical protein V6N13_051784 [Hibiscus sabdariffa]